MKHLTTKDMVSRKNDRVRLGEMMAKGIVQSLH